MGIFKAADREATLQKSIDTERTLQGELETRLAAAKKIQIECEQASSKAHANLADRKTLEALVKEESVAGLHVKHGRTALDDSKARLANLETQLAVAVKDKLQAEANKAKEQCIADLSSVGATLDAALDDMSTLAGKIMRWCPDARGIHIFTASARNELTAATSMLQMILKSGPFPPELVLAKPAPPPVALRAPAPMVSLLSTKAIKWTSPDGMLHVEQKWKEISLPIAAADRAVRIGAAVLPGDPLWKQKGFGPVYSPKLSDCVDLDPDAPAASIEPLESMLRETHSAFEKPVIGPKAEFKVPRGEPSLANATRNLPTSEGDK
jgi:hypothetical protein